jgi:hypothetical protein
MSYEILARIALEQADNHLDKMIFRLLLWCRTLSRPGLCYNNGGGILTKALDFTGSANGICGGCHSMRRGDVFKGEFSA